MVQETPTKQRRFSDSDVAIGIEKGFASKKQRDTQFMYTTSEDELLEFTSCFESGNLRFAVYNPEDKAYDLVLENDVHTRGYTQWFYFAVRNGAAGSTVTLRIVNFSKSKSLFRLGMRPVVWSQAYAAEQSRPGGLAGGQAATRLWRGPASELWRPGGTEVRYHRSRSCRGSHHCLAFDYTFEYADDCVFFAYCVPFTYTMLRTTLSAVTHDPQVSQWCRLRCLCGTLGDVRCDLLEISNWQRQRRHKKVVVVSARVHPGESNASWIAQGLIGFLLTPGPEAQALRDNFVWKIVPMLNPDGVVCGNYRCGLSGVDLNRQWRSPSEVLHGTVFGMKRLIVRSKKKANLTVYVDLHGHSRRCGIFSYACGSFARDDHRRYTVRMFPKLFSMLTPEFCPGHCRWRMGKGKRGTGRVVVAKDVGLTNTYTIEASFFGAPAEGWFQEGDTIRRVRKDTEAGDGGEGEEAAPEEDIPEVVLFTPAKLEEFGLNLARAVLLHQNLGPVVRRYWLKAEAEGRLDTRLWPTLSANGSANLSGQQTTRVPSPMESGTSTPSLASDASGGEGEDCRRAGRGQLLDSASSPAAPLNAKGPSASDDSGCGGGPQMEACAVADQSPQSFTFANAFASIAQPMLLAPPSSGDVAGGTDAAVPGGIAPDMANNGEGGHELYLGIDVEGVLRELQEAPASSSEPESYGSDSDPSEDNLGQEDLGNLSELLTRQRHSVRTTRPARRAGSGARRKAADEFHNETSRASKGKSSQGIARRKDEKLHRDKGQVRTSVSTTRRASAPSTKPQDLQKTVAFGQTTYVAPGFLGATPPAAASPSPTLQSSEPTSPAPARRSCARSPTLLETPSTAPAVSVNSGVATLQWPSIPQVPSRTDGSLEAVAYARLAGGSHMRHTTDAAFALFKPPKDRFPFAQGGVIATGAGRTKPASCGRVSDDSSVLSRRLYMRNVSNSMLQCQRPSSSGASRGSVMPRSASHPPASAAASACAPSWERPPSACSGQADRTNSGGEQQSAALASVAHGPPAQQEETGPCVCGTNNRPRSFLQQQQTQPQQQQQQPQPQFQPQPQRTPSVPPKLPRHGAGPSPQPQPNDGDVLSREVLMVAKRPCMG